MAEKENWLKKIDDTFSLDAPLACASTTHIATYSEKGYHAASLHFMHISGILGLNLGNLTGAICIVAICI